MKLELVPNWKKLWKSWVMWLAASGIAIPELLQVIADNTELLPWLDAGWKSLIRLACLVLVILARPVKQMSVSGQKE